MERLLQHKIHVPLFGVVPGFHIPLFALLLVYLQFSSLQFLSLAYDVPDKFFINCGTATNVRIAQRNFVGDLNSSDSISISFEGQNSHLTDTNQSSGTSPLYQTARVFKSNSSYEFDLNQNGTYIVRLHFFAFMSPINLSVARFNVWASGFSLLTNYSIRSSPTIQEFLVTNPEKRFKIYFVPYQTSLAFVNALEVFLAPEGFIPDKATPVSSKGNNNAGSGLISKVLHTIHRIDVGGSMPNRSDDLWRHWLPDDSYLLNKGDASQMIVPYYLPEPITEYIAPVYIYQTAKQLNSGNGSGTSSLPNVTWRFPVNKNAKHFIRLHFCDIGSKTYYDLRFNLYIYSNFRQEIYPFNRTQLLPAPFYVDFEVYSDDSRFINVSIGPEKDYTIHDAFLNGLEIMEFSKQSGSIPVESESKKNGGSTVRLTPVESESKKNGGSTVRHTPVESESKKNGGSTVRHTPVESESKKKCSAVIIGPLVSGAFLTLVMLVAVGLKWRKQRRDQNLEVLLYGGFSSDNRLTQRDANVSLAPSLNLSLRISWAEIRHATQNFKAKRLIGVGGFGKVYYGTLRNGTKVAVKRSEPGHGQGVVEFQTEIFILSRIRYRHLVSLVGYCDEGSEMILVYEFMEKGTLRDHLYHSNGNPERSCSRSELSWKQRLEICIGAAKGLHYLHTGPTGGITHRDVKSTNILLDENYVAKVADFGLSKSGLPGPDYFTVMKGTFGYLDPEYFINAQFTVKSDVYSFGMVLLEVLCARPVINNSLPPEEINLGEWGMQWQRKGQLEKIIDPVLVGKIKPSSLRKFGDTVEKCLKANSTERPNMSEVLYDLSYALLLQDTAMPKEPHEESITNGSLEFQMPFWHFPVLGDEGAAVIEEDDGSDITTSEV